MIVNCDGHDHNRSSSHADFDRRDRVHNIWARKAVGTAPAGRGQLREADKRAEHRQAGDNTAPVVG